VSESTFSENCLVTTQAESKLDQEFAQGGVHQDTQNRPFKRAKECWAEAQRAGQQMSVVFLDASVGGVWGWGVLNYIERTGNSTLLHYTLKEKFPKGSPNRKYSSLIVTSKKSPLSKNYIRNYVMCDRPAYVQ
jgi:hypothetical protein